MTQSIIVTVLISFATDASTLATLAATTCTSSRVGAGTGGSCSVFAGSSRKVPSCVKNWQLSKIARRLAASPAFSHFISSEANRYLIGPSNSSKSNAAVWDAGNFCQMHESIENVARNVGFDLECVGIRPVKEI
jgi:hypothetical protein